MMHDPFQTQLLWGAYPGIAAATGLNPIAINPLAGAMSPFVHQQGIPAITGLPGLSGYGGLIPQLLQQQQLQQQLHLAALAAQGVNPHLLGLTPFTFGLHNPIVSQSLQNPLLNPILAQYYQTQYPQLGLGGVAPFSQVGSIFGQGAYPLAPQSWIGQPGITGGSPFGQVSPLLSQLGGRAPQGHGISPWSVF